MHPLTVIFVSFFLTAGFAKTLLASPAMPHPECRIIGLVQSEEKRNVERNKNWAQNWGITKTQTYHDITIKIIKSPDFKSNNQYEDIDATRALTCNYQDIVQPFSIPDSNAGKFTGFMGWKKNIDGKCISAKVQVSGDEFLIGNWIREIQILDDEICMISDKTDK